MGVFKVTLEDYLWLCDRAGEVVHFNDSELLPEIENKRLVVYDQYGARWEPQVEQPTFVG